MPDPVSIAAALQAIKGASDIARGLLAAAGSLEKADLKLRIAELAEALVAARAAVLDVQEENHELRARVKELEAASRAGAELVRREGVLWPAQGEGGPYCVRCFEVDSKMVTLSVAPAMMAKFGYYRCQQCKSFY